MPAGHGDLEGALGVGLPLHLVEVDRILLFRPEKGVPVELLGLDVARPGEELVGVAQGLDAINVDPLDDAGLDRVLLRHEDGAESLLFRLEGQREDALDRTDTTVEGEFAGHGALLERSVREGAVPVLIEGGHADGDGKVETGPFLAQVGGGEVDRDLFARPAQGAVLDRGDDPVDAFTNSRIGQADDLDVELSGLRRIHLDLHGHGIDTVKGSGIDAGEGHGRKFVSGLFPRSSRPSIKNCSKYHQPIESGKISTVTTKSSGKGGKRPVDPATAMH